MHLGGLAMMRGDITNHNPPEWSEREATHIIEVRGDAILLDGIGVAEIHEPDGGRRDCFIALLEQLNE